MILNRRNRTRICGKKSYLLYWIWTSESVSVHVSSTLESIIRTEGGFIAACSARNTSKKLVWNLCRLQTRLIVAETGFCMFLCKLKKILLIVFALLGWLAPNSIWQKQNKGLNRRRTFLKRWFLAKHWPWAEQRKIYKLSYRVFKICILKFVIANLYWHWRQICGVSRFQLRKSIHHRQPPEVIS